MLFPLSVQTTRTPSGAMKTSSTTGRSSLQTMWGNNWQGSWIGSTYGGRAPTSPPETTTLTLGKPLLLDSSCRSVHWHLTYAVLAAFLIHKNIHNSFQRGNKYGIFKKCMPLSSSMSSWIMVILNKGLELDGAAIETSIEILCFCEFLTILLS